MKKIFFLMLMLLIGSVASMNAQVTIGSTDNPDPSAVLELKSANLGFLFPRVALQSTGDESTIANPAAGLTVYNTANAGSGATAVVPGIYFFNGTAWILQAPPVIKTQPAAFTFRRLKDKDGDPNAPASVPAVTLSVVASGATSYQWYLKPRNMNAPAEAINGATSATYNPTSTLTAWGLYQYYCVVSNAYGSVKSEIADVAVGCGAKTTDGGWISFMCQNLGAAPAVYTNTESSGYGLDDISFEWGADATNKKDNDAKGYLFQWGRSGRGADSLYQSRSSEAITGPVPDGSYSGSATTGATYLKKFIINTATPHDWRQTQDDLLWRIYRNGNNDPCPVGWRIPNPNEWESIFKTGQTGAPVDATANTWLWKQGGSGTAPENGNGYLIKPNGNITTLFLPATGHRDPTTGAFANQGAVSPYWSGAHSGVLANHFQSRPTIITLYAANRVFGLAIRCVIDQ